MLNRITIMGRLTADPELRHTQTGTPVSSFTLACERDFKDKETDRRTADFIDVVAWRGTGEFAARYFSKGRMAIVEGRLQTRTWEDKDGNKRKSVEIVAENIYFGDSKRSEDGPGISGHGDGISSPVSQQFTELDEDDGDLPFRFDNKQCWE